MGTPPAAFQPHPDHLSPPLGGTHPGAASSLYQFGHMSPTSASTGVQPLLQSGHLSPPYQSGHLSPPNHLGYLSPPHLSGGFNYLPDLRPPLEHSGSSVLNVLELGSDMIPAATSLASEAFSR